MQSTSHQPATYTIHDGLAVYAFGDGEPILFMPGPHRHQRPGWRTADALIEGLTQLGRRVITFDPPGSGGSTRPARLGMLEMHQCANEALNACGVSGRVDALGHSMGGLAVLAYAIELPQKVKRLVLVGTGSGGPAYMNAPGALWNRRHPAFYGMAWRGILLLLVPRLAPEKMMINFVERHSFYDKSHVEPKAVRLGDWTRPRLGRPDWHRVARHLDYSPRLGEIEMPALILCGRHDPQYPPACSEELAAGIRDARAVYFERSGHHPFIEEADAFWQAVGGFLDATR